ncbi:hypothetical protein T440DRAFT_503879 [Plenodomus tracheiphilus IPT5]|uniref:Protein with SprT-like domain at the N terminus n=1 Tax=Plenodomus tracheiphilus IPT5 TaxID=1408161 RepID=A0A6A7BLC4_9PLEO|nr:hypothetical protein T440DRAFT_503879 [Plenodomus tracheiphilus IPT5]
MPVTDEDAALAAIATLEALSAEQQEALRAVNAIIHNGEPFVDVHELFARYNILYFRKLLLPRVEVLWSPRLTLLTAARCKSPLRTDPPTRFQNTQVKHLLTIETQRCAGICELSKDLVTGKFTRIRLKLSTPLLQYRPRSDTINTLLHEAIHAYFFITTSWRHSRGDDGTGHGVGFQLLADAINNHGNYEVTIYHTFHDEVESYRTHVWQCNGICKSQPPYFGLVKRSMNRAPGKGDTWWARHEAECGGMYTKVQEPAPTKKQLDALSAKERAGRQKNKLDGWIIGGAKEALKVEGDASDQPIVVGGEDETPFRSSESSKKAVSKTFDGDVGTGPKSSGYQIGQKRSFIDVSPKAPTSHAKKMMVECPICNTFMSETDINKHLDTIHS